jgi:hypothetical protein
VTGYQFIHIEGYARRGARAKSGLRKHSLADIKAEAERDPSACQHIIDPLPPNLLFGVMPSEAMEIAFQRAAKAKDVLGRRLRIDSPVVLAGVASWPIPVEEMSTLAQRQEYENWVKVILNFLKMEWGNTLLSVIEHSDEPYMHLHFYCVAELRSDNRLIFSDVHPGHRTASQAKAAGKSRAEQRDSYLEGMRAFQDRYYDTVATPCGLTRIGPRRQRLTRNEWNEQQRAAARLAEGHKQLQKRAEESKAKLDQYLHERKREQDDRAAKQKASDEEALRQELTTWAKC